MTNLEKNVNHYMELKGITKYSQLLMNIAYQLGIKGEESYNFARREKSNFSKMLKGQRPLKNEFIKPLEKIFGVSLAKLLDEDAFKLPIEKENVPFDKGFRYYAYKDDPKLYREEFDLLLTKDGKSILTKFDEFGKTFLDYVVEYGSVKGVRYLYEEYGISTKGNTPMFDFNNNRGMTSIYSDNMIGFARLVARLNNVDIFNDIFDTYYMFFTCGDYGCKQGIFNSDDYLEIILDNDDLFKSIFEKKIYEYKLPNSIKMKKNVESVTYKSINPIINNCLRHSLKHLEKYKNRAIDILKFGIKHNSEIVNEIGIQYSHICNQLGRVKSYKNDEYCNIAIYVDVNVNDIDINELIQRLPKFANYLFNK